jgi:ABC-type multidrug transport system ATPase subunit
MTISLSDAGKRFNREWIFRHFTYTFEEGKSYAIIGPNGSGKSTLLQVISGAMHVNEGKIRYQVDSRVPIAIGSIVDSEANIQHPVSSIQHPVSSTQHPASGIQHPASDSSLPEEKFYRQISICAPYLEVVEEMNLKEFLNFHSEFKPLLPGLTIDNIISIIGMEKAANKQIRYYSSGMKQRAKLAQCIFSDVPVVLLDEPCTNLDTAGFDLYHRLINAYCKNRLVVVSSNDEMEYSFCDEKINISDYKK